MKKELNKNKRLNALELEMLRGGTQKSIPNRVRGDKMKEVGDF